MKDFRTRPGQARQERNAAVYPYKFVPIYKEKIWGGTALDRLFGRPLRRDSRIGESWELADLEEGQSIVAEGPEAGQSIRELLERKAEQLLGGAALTSAGRFPLLLKLLDANDILSLQVHPDEQSAVRLGPPAAMKTECWYVLESRGGYILKGIRAGVTADEFRSVLSGPGGEMAVSELVHRHDVRSGDFFYLPAGTVHALGPGVVVAEIQTPSDTTYRVSDWGRGRQIHVRQALECIHFQPCPPAPGANGQVLVEGPHFCVAKRQVAGDVEMPPGLAAWMVLSGTGEIRCHGGLGPVRLDRGQTVVLPASLRGAVLSALPEMSFLEIRLPEE